MHHNGGGPGEVEEGTDGGLGATKGGRTGGRRQRTMIANLWNIGCFIEGNTKRGVYAALLGEGAVFRQGGCAV